MMWSKLTPIHGTSPAYSRSCTIFRRNGRTHRWFIASSRGGRSESSNTEGKFDLFNLTVMAPPSTYRAVDPSRVIFIVEEDGAMQRVYTVTIEAESYCTLMAPEIPSGNLKEPCCSICSVWPSRPQDRTISLRGSG